MSGKGEGEGGGGGGVEQGSTKPFSGRSILPGHMTTLVSPLTHSGTFLLAAD